MNDRADFTQGSILKKLFWFMLPVLGALVLQAAYGAVDLLVVGRFGSTEGLSAVSTGSQVLNLVTFVVTQLAMGVTVLIARYLGEKREEVIGSVMGGALAVFAVLSVVLFVLLVVFANPISVLMQAPKEALTLTKSYVRKYMWLRYLFYCGIQSFGCNLSWTGRQQVAAFVCSCRMYRKHRRRSVFCGRLAYGCSRRSTGNGYGAGSQRCVRDPDTFEKETAVYHKKIRFWV